MNMKIVSALILAGIFCLPTVTLGYAQETVTSRDGKYHADARMAVPVVLKPYGYSCPALERKRGVSVKVSPNGKEVKVTTLDELVQSYALKPNYGHWKSRSLACLRGLIQEDGKPVKFALCAKLERGNGKKSEHWRSKGVFMEKNGTKAKVNVGNCR